MVAKTIISTIALKASLLAGIQINHVDVEENRTLYMKVLDKKEVENRGSHCLDGSAPIYFHSAGTTDKWAIELNSALGICDSEESCYQRLPIHSQEGAMQPQNLHEIFKGEGYHYVYVTNCDFGMFLGNLANPIEYKGTKMYFQGARIIKHVIDELAHNYTMKEVFFTGGSGGGQALFPGANYFRSLFPSSVQKFGFAPINGFWALEGGGKTYEHMFGVMNMQGIVNQNCVKKMGNALAYNCLDPEVTYDYVESPMFVTQILDGTFGTHFPETDLYTAYQACFQGGVGSGCNDERMETMKTYLNNFTTIIKSFKTYQSKGRGGYLSTCTEHIFYSTDNFWNYANKGVTAPAAIGAWWNNGMSKSQAPWIWPCKLGSANNPQCEKSC